MNTDPVQKTRRSTPAQSMNTKPAATDTFKKGQPLRVVAFDRSKLRQTKDQKTRRQSAVSMKPEPVVASIYPQLEKPQTSVNKTSVQVQPLQVLSPKVVTNPVPEKPRNTPVRSQKPKPAATDTFNKGQPLSGTDVLAVLRQANQTSSPDASLSLLRKSAQSDVSRAPEPVLASIYPQLEQRQTSVNKTSVQVTPLQAPSDVSRDTKPVDQVKPPAKVQIQTKSQDPVLQALSRLVRMHKIRKQVLTKLVQLRDHLRDQSCNQPAKPAKQIVVANDVLAVLRQANQTSSADASLSLLRKSVKRPQTTVEQFLKNQPASADASLSLLRKSGKRKYARGMEDMPLNRNVIVGQNTAEQFLKNQPSSADASLSLLRKSGKRKNARGMQDMPLNRNVNAGQNTAEQFLKNQPSSADASLSLLRKSASRKASMKRRQVIRGAMFRKGKRELARRKATKVKVKVQELSAPPLSAEDYDPFADEDDEDGPFADKFNDYNPYADAPNLRVRNKRAVPPKTLQKATKSMRLAKKRTVKPMNSRQQAIDLNEDLDYFDNFDGTNPKLTPIADPFNGGLPPLPANTVVPPPPTIPNLVSMHKSRSFNSDSETEEDSEYEEDFDSDESRVGSEQEEEEQADETDADTEDDTERQDALQISASRGSSVINMSRKAKRERCNAVRKLCDDNPRDCDRAYLRCLQ